MNRIKKTIIGNWKQNGSKALIKDICASLRYFLTAAEQDQLYILLCPPNIYIPSLQQEISTQQMSIYTGAQNVGAAFSGSFTGETSASMLKEYGCFYSIVGHSERRVLFGETDQSCNAKLKLLIQHSMHPVFCVGESLEELQAGHTSLVVRQQLSEALADLSATDITYLSIAYEPVYAIGSGLAVSPEQAQAVHQDIRRFLTESFGAEIGDAMVILYGGSVNEQNCAGFLQQADIDGLLVGGASLNPVKFSQICKSALPLHSGSDKNSRVPH